MTWFPKNSYGLGQLAGANSTYSPPKPELPEVGDTVLIAALPHGHQIIGEGATIPNGTDVIEVEVKALKKATLTVE